MARRLRSLFVLLVYTSFALPAAAAQHEVSIYLDLDDDPTTGCEVVTVAGMFAGAEQVLVSTVETTSGPDAGEVTDVELADCADEVTDTFGALVPVTMPVPPPWPVGIDNGVAGRDVVETYVPLAMLAVPDPSTVHLGVVVTDELGGEQALITETGVVDGPPILLSLASMLEIPTMSGWGALLLILLLIALAFRSLSRRETTAFLVLFCLAGVSGTVWAAGTLDGQVGDWTAVDQLGSNGIVLFGKEGSGDLCFRVDVDLLVNQPPDAVDDTATVDEDSVDNVLAVLANDADPEMGTLTISSVGTPDQGGTATTDGTTITYTPAASFVGMVTFTYTISDGNGGTDTATVTVTVDDANDDPPVCGADVATTDEDSSTLVDVLADDTDPDPGETTTLAVLSVDDTGTAGMVTNNGTDVTYDPNGQFEFLDDGEMDTDTFTYTARDTDGLTCTATVTVTITGVNDAPTVIGETFDVAVGNFDPAIGNTTLQFANADSVTHPHVYVAGDVLDNDADPEMDGLAITGFQDPSTEGGTVSFNLATGELTYSPPVGFEGTDSFTYTVSDGTAAAMGTVSIEVADMVWYLDNDPANDGAGDDGRAASPFDSIAQLEAVNGNGGGTDPEAGDVIFVFQGTSTYDAGGGDTDGIDLLDQQKLYGEGVDLVVQGLTLVSGNPAKRPSLDNTNASGDAVTVLADSADRTGIEIRGLSLDGTDNAVAVTSANTFQVGILISDNAIAGAGAEGLHLDPGSSGAFVAMIENNVFSTASAVGNAIDVTTAAASGDVEIALNGNTDVTSSGASGIVLDNSAGGGDLFVTGFAGNTVHGNTVGDGIRVLNATFDADPSDAELTGDEVSGGNTTVGVGNPVGGSAMVLTDVAGALAFGTLSLSTDGTGSVGLDVTGSGLLNAGLGTGFEITNTGGVISSTNGPAVVLDPLTAGLTFGSVSSSNSPTVGISLVDVAGSFAASAGSITGATGTSFNLDGGSPAVTYGGSIAHSSNGTRTIEIQNLAGGSATFDGAVVATDGTGIRIANNTGTNPITFASAVDLGSSGNRISDGTAFTMTGNSAGTTVAAPDVDVFTSGRTAVNASGAGTLDVDALSLSTVSNGRAIDLDGILSLVDVDTVSCSHNSNCVDLTNLAATSVTTFAGVELTCAGGTCFSAANARTVEVTGAGNTISATNAVGLALTTTTIGANDVTFESISASGAASGIVLDTTGTTGAFTVTGDGGTAGSGGTIQDLTGRTMVNGAKISNASNVSLAFMDFTNANEVDGGGAGVCDATTNAGCNAAINLDTVANIALANLNVSGGEEMCINGRSVTNFDLSNSLIENCGNAINEHGIHIRELLGTSAGGSASTIIGTTVRASNTSNVEIVNTTATSPDDAANPDLLVISGSEFRNLAAPNGSNGVFLLASGDGNLRLEVSSSRFENLRSIGLHLNAENGGDLQSDVTTSTFQPGPGGQLTVGIESLLTQSSTHVFSIHDNTRIETDTGTPINLRAFDSASFEGRVVDNPQVVQSTLGSGNGNGIQATVDGSAATSVILVEGNTIQQSGSGRGIRLDARGGSGQLHATLRNNVISVIPGGASTFPNDAIEAFAGNGTVGESSTLCVHYDANTSGDPRFADAYALEQVSGNAFQVQGLTPSPGASEAQVETFVENTDANPGSVTADVASAGGGLVVSYVAATCQTPPAALPIQGP